MWGVCVRTESGLGGIEMGEGRRVKHKLYRDDDKAAALAYLQSKGGSISEAAKEMGVPVSTMKRWASGQALGPGRVRFAII